MNKISNFSKNVLDRIPHLPPRQRKLDHFNRDIYEDGYYGEQNFWEEIDPDVELQQSILRIGIMMSIPFLIEEVSGLVKIIFPDVGNIILQKLDALLNIFKGVGIPIS